MLKAEQVAAQVSKGSAQLGCNFNFFVVGVEVSAFQADPVSFHRHTEVNIPAAPVARRQDLMFQRLRKTVLTPQPHVTHGVTLTPRSR